MNARIWEVTINNRVVATYKSRAAADRHAASEMRMWGPLTVVRVERREPSIIQEPQR